MTWESEFGAEYALTPVLDVILAAGLVDLSWHNDSSPSFGRVVADSHDLRLWAEHPDPEQREHQHRYAVNYTAWDEPVAGLPLSEDADLYTGDDLTAALAAYADALHTITRQQGPHVTERITPHAAIEARRRIAHHITRAAQELIRAEHAWDAALDGMEYTPETGYPFAQSLDEQSASMWTFAERLIHDADRLEAGQALVHMTGHPDYATACGIPFGHTEDETTGDPDMVTCFACREAAIR